MASNKFDDFLRGLAEDPNKLTEFENDPEAAMSGAGLSAAEKDAVRSGDEERIAKELGVSLDPALGRVIRIRNIRIRFGV